LSLRNLRFFDDGIDKYGSIIVDIFCCGYDVCIVIDRSYHVDIGDVINSERDIDIMESSNSEFPTDSKYITRVFLVTPFFHSTRLSELMN
jgi:hypothetical protein